MKYVITRLQRYVHTVPPRLINQKFNKPTHHKSLQQSRGTILTTSQRAMIDKATPRQLMDMLTGYDEIPVDPVIDKLITEGSNELSPNQFAYLVHLAHRRAALSSGVAIKAYQAMLAKYPADARSHTMLCYALPIYSHEEMFDQVISLYHYMETSNYPLNAVLLGIVLHACSKIQDDQTALCVYQRYRNDHEMAIQNQITSVKFIGARLNNSFNSDMYARGSRIPVSVSSQTPFNLIHFTHLVVALYDSDLASYSMEIVQDLHEYGIEPDLFFYTSVMYTLSSRSLWHESLEIMIDMQRHNVDVDEYCYYYAMLSCAGAGNWRRSFSLMDECKHRGLEMVPELYEAALVTAESARLYDRTRSLVEEMRTNHIRCSVKGYHSLIRQAHAQRDWHWCIRLYRTVMYVPEYHTNRTVNDSVLHSAHELNPSAIPKNQRSKSVGLHDPLYMTMDELFRFQFDADGILGPLGWWMLARPYLRTLRERGDSRKHCEHHMLGLTKYLLRALHSGGESPHSIGCFPIHRIRDKRVVNGSKQRNIRVFELTLNANHLDESIAAVDLIMYIVYYQSHSHHWPPDCSEAIKALPCVRDEITIKCIDSSKYRRIHANISVDNKQDEGDQATGPPRFHEVISNAPFADYTVMAPSEIDKVVRDPLAPMDASDSVGDNLQYAVYRAWVTMKRMFTSRPAPTYVTNNADVSKVDDQSFTSEDHFSSPFDDNSSDFRTVMISHLRDEYSVVGEPLTDPCCFKLGYYQLKSWVRQEETRRVKKMVEFNQLKLADNLKKSAAQISSTSNDNSNKDLRSDQ